VSAPPGGPGDAGTRNELAGYVNGPSVQAGHIHGGVTFTVHEAPRPGPQDRPDMVPPLTVRFVSRAGDLRLLGECLAGAPGGQPGSGAPVAIGAVSGLPGVGKTAIACRWASDAEVRARFPDGQLYVPFADFRDEAGKSDISGALALCLRGLGVHDAYMPKSLADREALFRTKSSGRRLLVVLDDVSQAAQARALLPKGPGSAVLVTSNVRLGELALDGARLLDLEPLGTEDGVRLLADRRGEAAVAAEPEAAERLVELCGGLPKALHIAAARLETGRRLTMSRLVEELADERRRLKGLSLRGEHSMSAVLGLAYQALPAEAAALYRRLGWVPGRTFDAGTAARAADVEPDAAEDLLAVLEEASLLDSTDDGRFRFHDLVRLHARERAEAEEPEGERRAVTVRVTTHYLVLTALADRALRAGRLRVADLDALLAGAPDPFAARDGLAPLAWLDAERGNVLAVLREASREELWALVWPLAEAFTVLFLHRRYLQEWRESLELGVAAAVAAVEPAGEARLRSLLSRPLLDLGELDRARHELEQAADRAELAGHTVLRASVQEFSGRYWEQVDTAAAVRAYERAVALNTRAGEDRGAAIARYFLGCVLDGRGAHREALAALSQAYDELLALDDQRMAGRATAASGEAYLHLGELAAAERALSEAVDILQTRQATYYEARARLRLAEVLVRRGRSSAAVRAHRERALAILREGGSPEADEVARLLDEEDGV
jgi:tetratricopeptide (TPR) repeat protein